MVNQMKVLVVIPTYWPRGSGGTLATHLVVKMLSEVSDLQLTILTSTRNPDKIEKPNVKYTIDPFVREIERRYPIPTIVMNRYKKLIENHDVIYIVYAYTFIPIAKKLKKKIVVHLHDYKVVSPSSVILYTCSDKPNIVKLIKESFRIKYLEQKNIKDMFLNTGDSIRTAFLTQWIQLADVVIAVSKRHAELLAKVLPSIREKLKVIYNPPPPIPSISKKLDPTPTFLYVGGDSYVKGIHILLEAITRFLRRGGKARFILTNRYSKETSAYINALNRRYGKEVIQVAGRIPYEELIRLYEKVWALIFPSIWEEPLPYAVIEALATRTIPIASEIGGVIELLSFTYFLFKPGDYVELSEKMLELAMMSSKEVEEIQGYIAMDYQFLKHTKLNDKKILEMLLKVIYDGS